MRCRQRLVGAVDLGDEAPAVGRLAQAHRRHDQLAGLPGSNGSHPMAIGTGDIAPRRVVVLDRAQHVADLVDRPAGGDTTAGDADAVAHEQVAVGPGDVVEVEGGLRVAGDARDGAHQRVPVSSWVMPPLSSVCVASAKPASGSIATMSAGAGR